MFRLAIKRVCALCLCLAPALLTVLVPSPLEAQLSFFKTYGGDIMDFGFSGQQTSDGGYVVAGYTSSFGAGVYDFYLVNTDSMGDTVWTRTYGGAGTDVGYSVQQTTDGGYVLCGFTSSFGATPFYFYLVRTNPSGDTLWTRIYGGADLDEGRCVRQTYDGGYVLAGRTRSFGAGNWDVYLVKTDSLGDTLWTRTFGGILTDEGNSVRQTEDGGYIIAGKTFQSGQTSSDMYLVRTDALGGALWTSTYGGDSLDEAWEVEQTWDRGFIVVGTTESFGSGQTDVYLVKTDSLGDTVWERTYGGSSDDYGYSVEQTMDGGYIIAGATRHGPEYYDVYLVKTTSSGDTLWTFLFGGPDGQWARSVRQTTDGGFIVAGTSKSSLASLEDAFLLRIEGREVHNVGIVSIDAPDGTVFVDSTCEVRATIRNFGNVTDSVRVTAGIDGYGDTLRNVELAPGAAMQVHFGNWTVPSTDSTTYTMVVCTHAEDDLDTTNDCMQKKIFAYDPTGVEEWLDRRGEFRFHLYQNEPNPFHRSTVIQYSLPAQCGVTLSVHDVTGALVDKLVDRRQGPGIFRVPWDAQGHADGIYFYRLWAGEFVETRKMVLVR